MCLIYYALIFNMDPLKMFSKGLITTCIYTSLLLNTAGPFTKQSSTLADSLKTETITSLILKLAID